MLNISPVKPFFISIHALRGEGDTHASKSLRFTETFQSTPSVGRATFNVVRVAVQFIISIHALRGEGDDRHTGLRTYPYHFNPRPPWGGRR